MEENNNKNEAGQNSDFEFLQEKIKERPVNKKKLLKRTLITASMALLFGLIACLTFLVLEPVFNNWLYPEEDPKVVTFPQEKDEMKPEDMLTELEMTSEAPSKSASQVEETLVAVDSSPLIDESTEEAIDDEEKIYLTEYQTMYSELHKVYKEVAKSIVKVTGVTSDIDMFNNAYESEGSISGVIVANNNRELLILTKKSPLNGADKIIVDFCDYSSYEAEIKKYDVITDMCIISVDLKTIDDSTMENISVATLGSSMDASIIGSPIIAIGNILGYKDSVCYGMVTTMGNVVTLPDSEYKLLTTDIYGSQNPTGILVDMEGRVIGIIENSYNHQDTKNLLSAIGISELKGMITKLSNGSDLAYLGMHVQDISSSVRSELGITLGAYIADIDIDSPAMIKGVQRGDIIVQVGEKGIKTGKDYMDAVRGCTIDEAVTLHIKRASKQEYQDMEITVVPKAQPEKKSKK